MNRIYYAERDTTLYEKFPKQNTGIDQILELIKTASGSKLNGVVQSTQYNTRFLIDFGSELTSISKSITSGDIPEIFNKDVGTDYGDSDLYRQGSASVYLRLTSADATDLSQAYDIEAYPISESWVNGAGHYSDTPIQKYGTSWTYRDSDDAETEWESAGGKWISSSGMVASQSFLNESPDIRMDVTNIVANWISGSIANHGFILKRTATDETDNQVLGNLKFFSRESHTIFVPRLEVCWDDQNKNSLETNNITSDTYVPYIKNIKSEYRTSEIARLRIGVRPDFPTKTYQTGSWYLTNERLPVSSSYEIIDSVTNDVIIKDENIWGNSTTKVSSDVNGSYIDLRMDSFMPERYYKIQIKCIRTKDTQTFDDFYFKVVN